MVSSLGDIAEEAVDIAETFRVCVFPRFGSGPSPFCGVELLDELEEEERLEYTSEVRFCPAVVLDLSRDGISRPNCPPLNLLPPVCGCCGCRGYTGSCARVWLWLWLDVAELEGVLSSGIGSWLKTGIS